MAPYKFRFRNWLSIDYRRNGQWLSLSRKTYSNQTYNYTEGLIQIPIDLRIAIKIRTIVMKSLRSYHVIWVLTWLANIGRSFYAWKLCLVLSFVYLNIQYWWIESLRKRTYVSSRFWCFKSDKSAIFELIFERFGPLNFWLLTND